MKKEKNKLFITHISTCFNSKEMLGWWEEGYITAHDENRIDTFNPIKRW